MLINNIEKSQPLQNTTTGAGVVMHPKASFTHKGMRLTDENQFDRRVGMPLEGIEAHRTVANLHRLPEQNLPLWGS